MIDKIKKVIELQEELNEEFGIFDVKRRHDGDYVQIDPNNILDISNGNEKLIKRNCDKFRHELVYEEDGILFISLLDDEEYEEYKKATAPTVAKERLSL